MISNGEIHEAKSEGRQWDYLPVKKLSAILRIIIYKHHSDFYYLNCLHSFATEKELESQKKEFENKDF